MTSHLQKLCYMSFAYFELKDSFSRGGKRIKLWILIEAKRISFSLGQWWWWLNTMRTLGRNRICITVCSTLPYDNEERGRVEKPKNEIWYKKRASQKMQVVRGLQIGKGRQVWGLANENPVYGFNFCQACIFGRNN